LKGNIGHKMWGAAPMIVKGMYPYSVFCDRANLVTSACKTAHRLLPAPAIVSPDAGISDGTFGNAGSWTGSKLAHLL